MAETFCTTCTATSYAGSTKCFGHTLEKHLKKAFPAFPAQQPARIQTTPPSSGGSDILGPTKMQMASSPPSHWVGRSSEVSGFSVTERLKPARLLRLLILILLLRSGINPNPGPGPYFCSPCSFRIKRTQPSVWCHICGYIHLKCSGLTHLNQHHPDYYCPTCTSTYILPPQAPGPLT